MRQQATASQLEILDEQYYSLDDIVYQSYPSKHYMLVLVVIVDLLKSQKLDKTSSI